MYFLFVLIGLSHLQYNSAYVLLQVRKQDNNHSNVDALIHKVVPSDKVDKIAHKLGRKQFSQNYNGRPEIDKNLDSVMFAIDTGAVKESMPKSDNDIVNKIVRAVTELANSWHPSFRAQEFIKPEVVHFRSDKPSLMFEINSKAIIKAVKDFLGSKKLANYVDKFTREAAVMYRSFQDGLRQG